MAKTYRWGDGKGKVHSISKGQHRKNVRAQRRAKLNDPARFTQPRGALDVQRDADVSANLRYGGSERALATQARQVPAWFQSYRDQVAGLQTGIKTGYDQAIKDVGTRQASINTADDTSRAALLAAAQKDAASRGATVDPSLFTNDVNAQNVRGQNAADFAGLLSSQGQATNTYLGGLQVAGSAAELGQKTRVSDEQKGVATDKGLYKSQYVSEARGDERKNLLEAKAFGLDTYKAHQAPKDEAAQRKATSRNQKRQIKATAKQNASTVNKYGYSNKEWQSFTPAKRQAIMKKLGPKGTGATPKSPVKKTAKTTDTKAKIRTGVQLVRSRSNGTPGYWNESYKTLVEVDHVDPVVARAIIQGARMGKVGAKTRKALLDDYGIDGLKFSRPKKAKPKSPSLVNPFD